MKFNSIKLIRLAAFAFVAFSFTGPGNGALESFNVNSKESVIKWQGYKVTGKHNGTVMVKNGKLDYQDGMLVGGSFDIDMASISCDDLEGEWAQKLEGHLKSDDFFGVENFPTAHFEITNVVSRGTPGAYRVTGDLTIKGITKSIKFNTDVKEEATERRATAKVTLDRAEYNVRYGSGSFFDNLGDKTIYDEFDLEIELVASK